MKKIIAFSAGVFSPIIAFAATTGVGTTFQNLVNDAKSIANTIIPLFMIIGVAVFLWGIVKYITHSGDEEARKSAQGYIIYGLIGIFVMVAFWGIITLLATTFGVSSGLGGTVQFPSVN